MNNLNNYLVELIVNTKSKKDLVIRGEPIFRSTLKEAIEKASKGLVGVTGLVRDSQIIDVKMVIRKA